jgi:hypothetical protein
MATPKHKFKLATELSYIVTNLEADNRSPDPSAAKLIENGRMEEQKVVDEIKAAIETHTKGGGAAVVSVRDMMGKVAKIKVARLGECNSSQFHYSAPKGAEKGRGYFNPQSIIEVAPSP